MFSKFGRNLRLVLFDFLIAPLSKKTLALIVLSPAIKLLLLLYVFLTTPTGYVFAPTSYQDDMGMLLLMKSHEWNFEDPFFEGKLVFSDPVLSSVFYYVPLGILSSLLQLDYYLFLIFSEFIISTFFLLVVARIAKYFVKEDPFIVLLIMLFAPGIMVLPYTAEFLGASQFSYLKNDQVVLPTSPLFHLADRSYVALAQAFGIVGIYFTLRRRFILSGVSLGLSSLIYPQTGFVYLLIAIATFFISENTSSTRERIVFVKKTLILIVLFGVLSLPWVISYLYNWQLFVLYHSAYFTSQGILGVFATHFTLLTFAALYVIHVLKSNLSESKTRLVSTTIFMVLFFIINVGILPDAFNSIMIMPSLLILLIFVCSLLKDNKIEARNKVLIAWVIISFFFFITDARYAAWNPSRIQFVIFFPTALLAYKFIKQRHIVKPFVVISLVVLLIQASFFVIYSKETILGHPRFLYWRQTDFNAIAYLRDVPGRDLVAAPEVFRHALPYYTNKRSLPSDFYPNEGEEYAILISKNASAEEKQSTIKKKGIKYILTNMPLDYAFLKEVYSDGETRIYYFDNS